MIQVLSYLIYCIFKLTFRQLRKKMNNSYGVTIIYVLYIINKLISNYLYFTVLFNILQYFTVKMTIILHLADAFIQSDLQMIFLYSVIIKRSKHLFLEAYWLRNKATRAYKCPLDSFLRNNNNNFIPISYISILNSYILKFKNFILLIKLFSSVLFRKCVSHFYKKKSYLIS